jgi:uncharacterized membrane protein YagU involved in acid resistance
MSSLRSYDPITRRRGTRGFAAIVTGLAGFVVLAAGLAPAASGVVDPTVRSWLVILAIAFAAAHLVAVVGLVRARPWSARLVGYLAALGIGASAYVLLVTLTGLDPVGATSALPEGQARAEGFGLAVWMIGLWLVAFRFAVRGFPTRRTVIRPSRELTFAG